MLIQYLPGFQLLLFRRSKGLIYEFEGSQYYNDLQDEFNREDIDDGLEDVGVGQAGVLFSKGVLGEQLRNPHLERAQGL